VGSTQGVSFGVRQCFALPLLFLFFVSLCLANRTLLLKKQPETKAAEQSTAALHKKQSKTKR
jgi:hypothetical protein